MSDPIPLVDLKAQYRAYKDDIDTAIQGVLDHGRFIMGPEVGEFETQLATFCGSRHAIGVSSGTDALVMIMMAENIGPGDAVFVPGFTFTATAEVLMLLGASPVFVDVDENDFNIDCGDLERRIEQVKAAGELTPRGILAVDLFGLPANYAELRKIANNHDLKLWADAALSIGGAYGTAKVGTLARATGTSFFPAKPLGCYGDGGAILTDDDSLADEFRSIRAHGKATAKYDIVRIGLNARLDTIQAAILLAKLARFGEEIERRNQIARDLSTALGDLVKTPPCPDDRVSAWAQYTIKVHDGRRDTLAEALKASGIANAIYYPTPMHLQPAYLDHGDGPGSLPVSEALSAEVLSLPVYPFMTASQVDRICETITSALK